MVTVAVAVLWLCCDCVLYLYRDCVLCLPHAARCLVLIGVISACVLCSNSGFRCCAKSSGPGIARTRSTPVRMNHTVVMGGVGRWVGGIRRVKEVDAPAVHLVTVHPSPTRSRWLQPRAHNLQPHLTPPHRTPPHPTAPHLTTSLLMHAITPPHPTSPLTPHVRHQLRWRRMITCMHGAG